jgi:L-lactate dehydrogenase complex protein LldG
LAQADEGEVEMTSARDDILRAVRQAMPQASAPATEDAVAALVPPAAVRGADDLLALFLSKLESVGATHDSVDRLLDLPARLAEWLPAHGLAGDFVLAQEDNLIGLDWAVVGLAPSLRAPEPLAPGTVVCRGFAGIAETGSIALVTRGPSRPVHNILADTHVVVLERRRVLATIEEVWSEARRGGLPRGLVFVTGPSRTADIEMKVEIGVHGALNLHVIVVGRGGGRS